MLPSTPTATPTPTPSPTPTPTPTPTKTPVPRVWMEESVRVVSDGSEVRIANGGRILTSDNGFRLVIGSTYAKPLSGFMWTEPPHLMGIMVPALPSVAATTSLSVAQSRTTAGQTQTGKAAGPPAAVSSSETPPPFEILIPPLSLEEYRFSFDAGTRLNYPAGDIFLIVVEDGKPKNALNFRLALVSNVELDLRIIQQPIPATSLLVDTWIEAANNYSENTLIEVTARIRETSGTFSRGAKIPSFAGSIRIDDVSRPLTSAYEDSVGDPLPKGQKGFFKAVGSLGTGERVNGSVFPFSSSDSPGGPGAQRFLLKSFREADQREIRSSQLRDRIARVRVALVGDPVNPTRPIDPLTVGSSNPASISQWVDLVKRNQFERLAGPDRIADWLGEHYWDIVLRDPRTLDPVPSRPEEREDVCASSNLGPDLTYQETLAELKKGHSTPQPMGYLPATTDLITSTTRLFSFHPALRAGRSVPNRPYLWSSIVLHESRHAWVGFLSTIWKGSLTTTGERLTDVLDREGLSHFLHDSEGSDPRVTGIYSSLALKRKGASGENILADNDDDLLKLKPLAFRQLEGSDLTGKGRGDFFVETAFVRTKADPLGMGVLHWYINVQETDLRPYTSAHWIIDSFDVEMMEAIIPGVDPYAAKDLVMTQEFVRFGRHEPDAEDFVKTYARDE